MSGDNQVSISVDSEIDDIAAGYSISTYKDDPNVDMKLQIGIADHTSVDIELTDTQAGQLAVDLLKHAVE